MRSRIADIDGLVAVQPVGGQVIHLHLPGYRPSSKRQRGVMDSCGLCGLLLKPPGVPLAEALDWISRVPTAYDPRPPWRWCRVCVGHLIDLAGLADEVLRAVTGPHPAAHESCCPARQFRPDCACVTPPPPPTFAILEPHP